MRALRLAMFTMSIAVVAGGGGAAALADDGGGGDLGSQSPEQVLAATKAALLKVHSVHVAGTETDKDGAVTKLSGDMTTSGGVRLTIGEAHTTVRVIVVGKATYLKADAAYWRSSAKAPADIARKLAPHWVKVPASGAKELEALAVTLSPKHVAQCLGRGLGTLTNKGVRTVAGSKVVVLQDAGDKPGTSPGELWIAAGGGAPLPVRQIQTGPSKPGGAVDKTCDGDGPDTSAKSDLTLGRYDRVAKVTAPKGAIVLPSSKGGSGTQV